jgi:N utilization substance protein A
MIQQVEAVLVKKDEGRPVTPEEYQLLSRFVNRVETGAEDRRTAELEAQKALEDEARATIPTSAFDIPLDDLGISPRITINLTGEGYSTIGDLMMQLAIDSDVILAMNGVGPKTMESIQEALDGFEFPEPEIVEVEEEAPAEVEEETADVVEVDAEAVEAELEAVPEAVAETVEEETAEEAEIEAEPVEVEEVEEPEAPEEVEPVTRKTPALTFIDDDPGVESFDKLDQDKKKPSKRRKYREIEYDPDLDVTIVRKRRKRGDDEWSEEDDF